MMLKFKKKNYIHVQTLQQFSTQCMFPRRRLHLGSRRKKCIWSHAPGIIWLSSRPAKVYSHSPAPLNKHTAKLQLNNKPVWRTACFATVIIIFLSLLWCVCQTINLGRAELEGFLCEFPRALGARFCRIIIANTSAQLILHATSSNPRRNCESEWTMRLRLYIYVLLANSSSTRSVLSEAEEKENWKQRWQLCTQREYIADIKYLWNNFSEVTAFGSI